MFMICILDRVTGMQGTGNVRKPGKVVIKVMMTFSAEQKGFELYLKSSGGTSKGFVNRGMKLTCRMANLGQEGVDGKGGSTNDGKNVQETILLVC